MDDALRFMDVLLPALWIAFAIAIGVFVLALLSRLVGLLARLLAPWVGPRVRRLSRARAGVAEDAPRWACRACHSVNEPIAKACYRCGTPPGEDAVALPDRGRRRRLAGPCPGEPLRPGPLPRTRGPRPDRRGRAA